MTVTLGLFALSLEDYETRPTWASVGWTFFGFFIILCLVEQAVRPFLSRALAAYCDLPCLLEDKENIKLSRSLTIVISMGILTWLGYDAIERQGGFSTLVNIAPISDITVPVSGGEDVHVNRVYGYLPAAQRIQVFHAAMEVKSFIDSLIHNDGLLFLAHHVGAFLVSIGSMVHGPIYHCYATYFLGFSEASSTPLAVVALLDDSLGMGPPGLGDKLPIAKNVFGAIFAVLFLAVRVIGWLFVAYAYVIDGRAVLASGTCQSEMLVKAYIGAVLFFTLLQLIWCVDLFKGIYHMVAKPKPVETDKKKE